MSKNTPQDPPLVLEAKKKAKHLHSALKKNHPDFRMTECRDAYAKAEGFRDWNTLAGVLRKDQTEKELYEKLDDFADQTLTPLLTSLAEKHDLQLTFQEYSFFSRSTKPVSRRESAPEGKIEALFGPRGMKNLPCGFWAWISVWEKRIFLDKGDLYFVFPEEALETATKVLANPMAACATDLNVRREDHLAGTDWVLSAAEGEASSFSELEETLPIYENPSAVAYFQKELAELLVGYQHLFKAFGHLAEQWDDPARIEAFCGSLWDTFSGQPRYAAISTEAHRLVIKDLVLVAGLSKQGPHISGEHGGVDLGICAIIYHRPEDGEDDRHPEGPYIAKYADQRQLRISLKGLSREEVERVSVEFGIPIRTGPSWEREGIALYYQSNAFKGLQAWIKKNPLYAEELSKGTAPYLPYWYEIATGQRPAPEREA